MAKKKRTLLELIDQAQSDLNTYRYPDTSAVEERLDPILKALGEHVIGGDRLVYLRMCADQLSIGTEYSVRSCQQTNAMKIPREVLFAPDPVKAATLHAAGKKVRRLTGEIAEAERRLQALRDELAVAKRDLAFVTERLK